MPRQNDWARLFGAKRRASDRALLMEVEKSITAAELRDIELDIEREERARAKIAPLEPNDEERTRIAAAFGRPAQ